MHCHVTFEHDVVREDVTITLFIDAGIYNGESEICSAVPIAIVRESDGPCNDAYGYELHRETDRLTDSEYDDICDEALRLAEDDNP